MARKTRCTPEVRDAITGIIADGNYLTVACSLVGITYDAAMKWLERGTAEIQRRDDAITIAQRKEHGIPTATSQQPYVEFVEAYARARAEAEQRHVKNIERIALGGQVVEEREELDPDGKVVARTKKVALGDWRASAHYLERVHTKRWGRRQTVEVTGSDGGPVAIDTSEGAKIAERLRGFLDRVQADPRVIEGEVVRRAITVGGAPVEAEDGSEGHDGNDG